MKNTNIVNSITATHKPIAYCLYRVSTVGQVDKVKNDIPMQKEECREFAARHDWIIGKEFLEKGVSGFKVSAENRDAIQELKIAAIKGELHHSAIALNGAIVMYNLEAYPVSVGRIKPLCPGGEQQYHRSAA